MLLNIVNTLDTIAQIIGFSFMILLFITGPFLVMQLGYSYVDNRSKDGKIRNLRYGMNINDVKDKIGCHCYYATNRVLIYKEDDHTDEYYKHFIEYKLIFNDKGEYISTEIHKYRIKTKSFD